jgi:hypothetical protein
MDELPTKPAAYWNPSDNLSKVYYLRKDGSGWWMDGNHIDPAIIPLDGLRFLADYQ